MGKYTAKALGATPPTPPTGYVTLYNDGADWKYITDSGSVFTLSTGISAEAVQDIVGSFFADSSTINVTYNDAGDVISADVIAGGVNHNALLNYVANQHIDHSAVSISAGTGLTGGGDITTSRTISMPNTGTAGTYRSVTTDAQGRVTAGTNPTTLAGYGITDAQPLDSDLTAIAGLAGTGLVTRTGTGTATTRTITAGTGISLSNGDGVSGNPTVTNTDTGTSAVSTHVGLGDPHTQYELEANLAADVRNTVLTGFSASPNSTVLATDAILAAIGKLQAQINAIGSAAWTELCTTSTYSNTSTTTGVNVTELAISVTAGNRYYFEATLLVSTATAGTGIGVTMTSPDGASAPGALMVNVQNTATDGTGAIWGGNINSLGDYVTSTGSTGAGSLQIVNMKGCFPCDSSGTFEITFRTESSGNAAQVLPGSTVLLREFT